MPIVNLDSKIIAAKAAIAQAELNYQVEVEAQSYGQATQADVNSAARTLVDATDEMADLVEAENAVVKSLVAQRIPLANALNTIAFNLSHDYDDVAVAGKDLLRVDDTHYLVSTWYSDVDAQFIINLDSVNNNGDLDHKFFNLNGHLL